MRYPTDMTGFTFGRLTVQKRVPSNFKGASRWQCICECGSVIETYRNALVSGRSKSCGCLLKELASARFKTHGLSTTPEWRTWFSMTQRCSNPADPAYPNYGGRGITVCERWRTFEPFLEDMGYKPFKGASIERQDNEGNYNLDNCRWATAKEQANNRRSSRILEMNGKALTVAQWAEEMGLKSDTILHRLKLGWSVDQALTKPIRVSGRWP